METSAKQGVAEKSGLPVSPQSRSIWVKNQAKLCGFEAVRVAKADVIDPENHLGEWLRNGFHADMDWMSRSAPLRQDVSKKLPGARSVVVLAKNYHAPRPSAAEGSGKVAAYAWGRDYHNALKKPLRRLAAAIQSLEEGAGVYASVDAGPVMERAWAARSGLASIGKNSLALRRDMGSWFFLATVITTVELAPDLPAGDICGTCTACIDACPTDAIREPYIVDSRRCISYQTIENRGEIPMSLHEAHGDWVFGCDICQEVCPWNRFATVTEDTDFHPRAGHSNPDLQALAEMDEETFRHEFEGTPILRAKWKGIVRNARIALRNLGLK